MQPFDFKETILIRSTVSLLFGLAAGVIAVGAFAKAFSSDGSPLFVLPGLVAAGVMLTLFWFFVASYNSRQFVTVTPAQVSSRSRARGVQTIYWHDLAGVSETPFMIEKIRGIMPIVEIMISYYFLLPIPATSERRGLFNLAGKDGTRIVLREHLLFPHRLEQLRQATTLYAPTFSRTQLNLKSNTQN